MYLSTCVNLLGEVLSSLQIALLFTNRNGNIKVCMKDPNRNTYFSFIFTHTTLFEIGSECKIK